MSAPFNTVESWKNYFYLHRKSKNRSFCVLCVFYTCFMPLMPWIMLKYGLPLLCTFFFIGITHTHTEEQERKLKEISKLKSLGESPTPQLLQWDYPFVKSSSLLSFSVRSSRFSALDLVTTHNLSALEFNFHACFNLIFGKLAKFIASA